MSFEKFCAGVSRMVSKSGTGIVPKFYIDDHNRFVANCGDVTILGNSGSLKVTVRSGVYHQFQVAI